MKRGDKVLKLSKTVLNLLKPYSNRIEIAGSIRRKNEDPRDIDIVLIPKDKEKLELSFSKKAKRIQGGNKKSVWIMDKIKVELYYTNNKEWGATLLAYSGKKGSNIGLRIIARLKGFKLNQHGLFDRKTGKFLAGKTEREIYFVLKRPYKEPWER
jgi:DNA polymerase (family 10)